MKLSQSILYALTLVSAMACRGGGGVRVDDQIRRNAEAGGEAYAEGLLPEADRRYSVALKRAWLLDDSREIAQAAYNLAAVRASADKPIEALDLLAEARAEFARSGMSLQDPLLLEAKLLRTQGHDSAARRDTAAAVADYCESQAQAESWLHDVACWLRCLHPPKECKEPECPTPRQMREGRKVRDARFEVQAHLMHAQFAIDECRLDAAVDHLQRAESWISDAYDAGASAEWLHVAGNLAMARGEYDVAAKSFDGEAILLKQEGNYRELTTAYEAAGEAYAATDEIPQAAMRILRSARSRIARGEYEDATALIIAAGEIAEVCGNRDLQARAAIMLHFIAADSPPARKSSAKEKAITDLENVAPLPDATIED